MATVKTTLALDEQVTARCLRCGRTRELDLVALAASGRGGIDLADLPLRCWGVLPEPDGPGIVPCDGTAFGFTVGARNTGPRR